MNLSGGVATRPVGEALRDRRLVLRPKGHPMLNDVQHYVSVFAHLALACTFGLSLAIGIAGASHAKTPLGCRACADIVTAKMKAPVKVATLQVR
jgi:hypothetical protein